MLGTGALAVGVLGAALLASGANAATSSTQTGATVITLTQTACQFLEPEGGVNHGFKTKRKKDCMAINEKNGDERSRSATPLRLKAGKHIFRVTNKDVPYEVGFWLRGAGFERLVQPNVSGRGLTPGATRDYSVELTPGNYAYSCPLNPTPDYPLFVKE